MPRRAPTPISTPISTPSNTASVLCVGQATLDHVFTVAGPLRAGHKQIAEAHTTTGGGVAANAAVTVARLGGRAVLAGRVGDDHAGDVVAAGLEREGVDTQLLGRAAGVATPVSAVIVGSDGARTIVNHTPVHLFHDTPGFGEVEADAVLVDGRWAAGTAAGLERARQLGVPGVVDVDRRPPGDELATMFDLATHLVFGEDAAAAVAGTGDPTVALRRIAGETEALVAVTCGEQGVWWREAGGSGDVQWQPAHSIDAVDTTAAGDVFHGAFALALAEQMSTSDALGFAAAASAIKCTRHGARDGIPTRGEVEDLLVSPSEGH